MSPRQDESRTRRRSERLRNKERKRKAQFLDESSTRRSKRLRDKEKTQKARLQEKARTQRLKRLRDKEKREQAQMRKSLKKIRYLEMLLLCHDHLVAEHKDSDAELESILADNPGLLTSFSSKDITVLHIAFLYGRSYKVIELLVRRNPDALGTADPYGCLPLHYLCCFYEEYRVEDLLLVLALMVDTCPMSVTAQDGHGETPLHTACRHNAPFPVIEYLIKCDPQSLQIKSRSQHRTPFHLACENVTDLLAIQLLYETYPLAAQWRTICGVTPLQAACNRNASLEIINYLAFECCPVDCLLQYGPNLLPYIGSRAETCLEEVAKEAISALTDVAFHVTQILSEQLIKETARLAAHFLSTDGSTPTTCWMFNYMLLNSVFKEHKELRHTLELENSYNNVQELLDSVIRMNRAGRKYLSNDPNNKVKGMKALQAANSLNALFFHLRENPALSCNTKYL